MKKLSIIIPLLSFFVFVPAVVSAATTGYAYSENVGWLDSSEVTVDDIELTGYLYSGNIGWISLNCSNTASCSTVDYKVSNSSGNLSGYAYSENAGWIDMNDVEIDPSTGIFSGYAYSGNIGWISFNCSNTDSCSTVDYKVTTDWTEVQRISSGGSRSSSSPKVVVPKTEVVETELNISEIIDLLLSLNIISPDEVDLIKALLEKNHSPEFTINLTLNSIGEEVRLLQQFLNSNGYPLSATGLGSPGNETNFFGNLTRDALVRFQRANNISPAVGYFGPITRKFIADNY